jgi:hypothetical protein
MLCKAPEPNQKKEKGRMSVKLNEELHGRVSDVCFTRYRLYVHKNG